MDRDYIPGVGYVVPAPKPKSKEDYYYGQGSKAEAKAYEKKYIQKTSSPTKPKSSDQSYVVSHATGTQPAKEASWFANYVTKRGKPTPIRSSGQPGWGFFKPQWGSWLSRLTSSWLNRDPNSWKEGINTYPPVWGEDTQLGLWDRQPYNESFLHPVDRSAYIRDPRYQMAQQWIEELEAHKEEQLRADAMAKRYPSYQDLYGDLRPWDEEPVQQGGYSGYGGGGGGWGGGWGGYGDSNPYSTWYRDLINWKI